MRASVHMGSEESKDDRGFMSMMRTCCPRSYRARATWEPYSRGRELESVSKTDKITYDEAVTSSHYVDLLG